MTSRGLGLTESLSQDISQEELDFNDLFLYNTGEFPVGCDKDDTGALFQDNNQPPLLVVEHPTTCVSTSIQPVPSQNTSSRSPLTEENLSGAVFESLELAVRSGNIAAPSPRIEITPSGDSLSSQTLNPSPGSTVLGAYRECVSPASSNSSTGWPAESYSPVASPCVSPSIGGGCSMGLSALDLCPGLQSIHTSSTHSSPRASPRNSVTDETHLLPQHQRAAVPLPHQRSRSASPHGKRVYDQGHSCLGGTPVKQRSRSPSPIPSSHEQQGSLYLHQYQAHAQPKIQTPSTGLEEDWSSCPSRAVPSVMVRSAHGQAQTQDCVYGDVYDWAIEQERICRPGAEVKSDTIYIVPPVWPPSHPVHHSTFSGLSMAPLPSLEWPLPSQSSQYELLILQQPRSHHRAHYETEGSRGAVKTPKGGHPEVQLRGYQGLVPLRLQVFIGTADERLLKPHAFYQVHRITGKTVTTPSMERVISGTKVLDIPLEPTNHMRVMIDCVGILKLRNADIELRNGETDIGRKNTRVRLVFRVHVPQSGGQLVSLQVASDPIECSQRSAQELPAVERHDLDRCSVLGGQQMVLIGQNFTPDSKVIFSEKTQDGQQIWEVEAAVDKDKTQANMLFAEVPPYRDRTICHPAKVNFYVINGKKKRSQPQHFIYTPVIAIKAEPPDDYHSNSYGSSDNWSLSLKSLYHHHLEQDSNLQALSVSPTLYHLATVDPRACAVTLDSQDDPSAYYQSGASSLISSPMLYHTPNQHYSSCGAALLSGFPVVSHSASSPGAKAPVGKLTEGSQVCDSYEACLMSRQQTAPPVGKSPPPRFIQSQAPDKAACRAEPGEGHHKEWAPERVTVKEENLSYAYLEDVNDIIRRDLKGHSGE
ncbi:nuclear factor of activated T-cells, cytoplasmic 2-like [Solea senegalensis]|uniref:Nuclear factor of activated T-cells, cytoplasmic 2-like n=1 Tax=Solea senegalensis TaxID=28829 RepID=A0AAV6QN91_SOLSE|nr:nuclear factor of activated T-cells, cytoplasmic 2-like isoform X2 [Solea senegalensis]KAG7493633.1 nuclear factor of activated T-cells, cytoplasmic 2-like [Solea senegalensis]